jgi:hypothetical protein
MMCSQDILLLLREFAEIIPVVAAHGPEHFILEFLGKRLLVLHQAIDSVKTNE